LVFRKSVRGIRDLNFKFRKKETKFLPFLWFCSDLLISGLKKKDGIGSGSRVFFILCELLSYETVKKKGSVPGSFDVSLLV
jgi:hypothetical protein